FRCVRDCFPTGERVVAVVIAQPGGNARRELAAAVLTAVARTDRCAVRRKMRRHTLVGDRRARERMNIISTYREVGTYRGAAELCGTTHKMVKRAVERAAAGGPAQ